MPNRMKTAITPLVFLSSLAFSNDVGTSDDRLSLARHLQYGDREGQGGLSLRTPVDDLIQSIEPWAEDTPYFLMTPVNFFFARPFSTYSKLRPHTALRARRRLRGSPP